MTENLGGMTMRSLWTVVLAVALSACGAPPAEMPDAGGEPLVDAGANPVDAGPQCLSDDDCRGSLVCAGGLCQRPGCEVGREGCACTAGGRCARGADGNPLMCVEGICSSPSCPAGDSGCICVDGERCNDASATCTNGYCVASGCDPGADGCPCLSGTCDANLVCLGGAVCVSNEGYEGGACLESGRCHPGNRCNPGLDVCVHCDPGTEGCSCTDAGTCGAGFACNAGLCVSASSLPPSSPVCYTSCNASSRVGGAVRTCDSDGLMAGCLSGRSCVDGSCVLPGESPPTCRTDAECPLHQACLTGHCYSNCEDNLDCSAGLGCYRRVCRVPCQSLAGADPCTDGMRCSAQDGENGYCVPNAPTSSGGGEGSTEPTGFTLDHDTLLFTNLRTSSEFHVSVEGTAGVSRPFTVRRISHEWTDTMGVTRSVRARRDETTGAVLPCDASAGECPLYWLDLEVAGAAASRDPEIAFVGEAGCGAGRAECPRIVVGNAGGLAATRWRGVLEIASEGVAKTITLDYTQRADGQWIGSMYTFGNFPTQGLRNWVPSEPSTTRAVANALIQRWSAFRAGDIAWDEMKAVLTSTETESWRLPGFRRRCTEPSGACYPYTNASGVRSYIDDLAAYPIPTGVAELPIVMNVRQAGATLEGRIDSAGTLQYPGDPALRITMSDDPSRGAAACASGGVDCRVFLTSMLAQSTIGGRFLSSAGACPTGFAEAEEPWLVPGFSAGTALDGSSGRRSRTWCVDSQLPFGATSAARQAANRSLALGNPVADGTARTRTLRLIDGALVNQNEMFILFEERVEGFVTTGGSATSSAYGYILLTRRGGDLDESDANGNGTPDLYEGSEPLSVSRAARAQSGATCDPALVEGTIGVTPGASGIATLNPTQLADLTGRLLGGTGAGTPISSGEIHYYCEDTGLFDGGPDDTGLAGAVKVPCPEGSRVEYFRTALSQAQVAAQACQADGTCQGTLNLWLANGTATQRIYVQCAAIGGTTPTFCDDDRLNLRNGKAFSTVASTSSLSYGRLEAEIDDAFRYRTRFTSATGGRVGFAPQVCIPGSDRVPYCYDPPTIELARDRIDCLLDVYRTRYDALSTAQQTATAAFLRGDFANFASSLPARDGFERLYSELLVMQGDEAMTRAFMSRFDLAEVGGESFQGSLLEPGGIDLTGVAGGEMAALYRAVQYYQMALDRLYSLGPDFTGALARSPSVDTPTVFLSAPSVTLYLERLIRASTQRARAWSEIARRYQRLNRPDLAQGVVQRAYVSAFVEGGLITRLMAMISERSRDADQAQIELAITQAQRRYRMALLDMRDLFASLGSTEDLFGYPRNYIPFPALDGSARGRNAFEVVLEEAQTRLAFARMREELALASNRSFQTDTAQFQAELIRLRNTYENQLGDLCGTFTSELDGRIYPAITKYAAQSRYTQLLGDPCGRMGNGQIHNALIEVQQARLAVQRTQSDRNVLFERIANEQARVTSQCGLTSRIAEYRYSTAGAVRTLQQDIAEARMTQDAINAELSIAMEGVTSLICAPDPMSFGANCVAQAGQGIARVIGQGAIAINNILWQDKVIDLEGQIAQTERTSGRWVELAGCEAAQIESNTAVANMTLELRGLTLDDARNALSTQLALSEIDRLFNLARRLELEQQESEGLLIDVESARNDPNVRVYRNDAVRNADLAFDDALRSAYRATRVFEYYTSQTYPRWEELFLIRMVTAGDYNLENYLLDLQNAFIRFDETGAEYSDAERTELMRARLRDVDLLDENGYISLSFGTGRDLLSPLTRNHKIDRIEISIDGTVGDNLGRLYLRPTGSSFVVPLGGRRMQAYDFPQRTAVVNTMFNGARTAFSPEIYSSTRLRDRPVINTGWNLILNRRDESVNTDIDLAGLTDIRVFVYYTDFTEL